MNKRLMLKIADKLKEKGAEYYELHRERTVIFGELEAILREIIDEEERKP